MKRIDRVKRVSIAVECLNSVGGSIRFVFDLMYTLKRFGYCVSTYLTQKTNWEQAKKQWSPPIVKPDAEHAILPFSLPMFGLYQQLFIQKTMAFARKTLEKDEVMINSLGNFTPVVTDINYVHGALQMSASSSGVRTLYTSPYEALRKAGLEKYLQRQDQVVHVANSKYTAENLKKLGVGVSRVVYPPIAHEMCSPMLNHSKKNEVVIVSRFARRKGLEESVEVARQLPDVKFNLVCFVLPADYREFLVWKKTFPKNVVLCMNRPYPERCAAWARSKVFIGLYRREAFGTSVAEAVSAGCTPIVHEDGGGVLEIVDGVRHFEVSELKKEDVEKALSSWNHERALRDSQLMKERFGLERFAAEFMPIVETVREAKCGLERFAAEFMPIVETVREAPIVEAGRQAK